jgi:hypothetical protein
MRKESRISELMGLPTGAPVAALLSAVLVGGGGVRISNARAGREAHRNPQFTCRLWLCRCRLGDRKAPDVNRATTLTETVKTYGPRFGGAGICVPVA